ncbi:tandem-type lipoprotein [Staphylococcus epidermidis]|nr:tandem-type lipoprotein [Staphylococcus epidermidis]MCG2493602.1 tandem-type lipoprotein [Staphylococcus epidermidis]MDH9608167.1 tandem-type lipoprotein [Staphylococcus epidermidis]UIK43245.1 tandem-type lipoprotein [Staphylococcus epidermidis]
MKYYGKFLCGISFLILTYFIGGCGFMNKDNNKEAEIKESFNKTLSMYPIKNLEDLYDKEGYRDEEFEKEDKGTWIINSEMNIQKKGQAMKSRGMVLYMNRNTRKTTGHFYTSITTEDKKGRVHSKDKEYPVRLKNNKIEPTKPIADETLKNEIKNFQFFSQYGNFKNLKDYKNGNISYNPNVPSYSAEYHSSNEDDNVKQLRKRYNIPTKKAPKLILKCDGNLKGSSIGHKHVELSFVRNKEESIYFADSLEFNPSDVNNELK